MSIEMQQFGDLLTAQSPTGNVNSTIGEKRQQMEIMSIGLKALGKTDDISLEAFEIQGEGNTSIDAVKIETGNENSDQHLIYFHGGGYSMGSLTTHTELMGRLSRTCEAKVLGVDYRLAPEHKFPAALQDGVSSYHWLLNQGVRPENIILAGDSAGGGLVMATLLSLKDSGVALPAGAILMSPWTDLSMTGESIQSRAEQDPMISLSDLTEFTNYYCNGNDTSNPLISPIYGEMSGLPPMLIQVGDYEVLLDDSRRLAEQARAAGVLVQYEVFEQSYHVFQAVPNLPESKNALASIGKFCQEHFS